MCPHGTSAPLIVYVPPNLSHTARGRITRKPIDACIAPLIQALNEQGVLTANSCCGHQKGPGAVSLADGRELYLVTRETP